MNTAHAVNVWTRPKACEASSCPEWQPTPGGVRIRSSLRPDAVVELDHDEWTRLLEAAANGEVVVGGN